MTKLALSAMLLLAAFCANAAVPVKTNTASLVVADVCDGSWSDFNFQGSGYDDQAFSFNYTGITLDQGLRFGFRLSKPIGGPLYADIPNSYFTATATNIRWTIAHSNVPPAGTYYGELLAYDADTTNIYRSLGQGTLAITWSLYSIDADYFESITTTNAQTGQVYVHPNWIAPPWIATTNELGATYATWTAHNVLSNYADAINLNLATTITNLNTASNALNIRITNQIQIVSGMVVAAQADIDAHELLEGTNVHGLGTLAIEDDAPEDGSAYVRQDGAWTNAAAAGGYVTTNQWATTNLALQAQIDTLNEGAFMHRYAVITTASEQAYVLASTTNITAVRASTTITLTIPSGTRLYSMSGRWNGVSLGSSFTLVVGTNDMANADITDQAALGYTFFREDNGRAIAGAYPTLDMVNFDRYTVEGLPTATISKYYFSF